MKQARITKVASRWTPPGKRKPGWPKTTGCRPVMADLSVAELT